MRIGALAIVSLLSVTAAQSAVIRVAPGGDDANNGSTWTEAKRTIGAAIGAANTGDEIWVAAGTYAETIRNRTSGGIAVDVALYGGFAGNEATRDERDFVARATIIDGGGLGSVVTIDALAGPDMRVDGFRIRNGQATFGGGVQVTGAAPTITNNDVLGNQADHGGGIMVWGYRTIPPVAHARIVSNVIQVNRGGSGGGGVAVVGASPEIRGNTILRNTTGGYGGGIGVWVSESSKVARPWIANNFIFENAANRTTAGMTVGGGGIFATERNIGGEPVSFGICTPRIEDNLIAANAAIACGGGIAIVNADTESAPITNNTVVANSGSGICWGNSGPTIVNNIVALNTWGVEEDVGNPVAETIRFNDVWGNSVHGENTDYFQLADRSGIDGNISTDPLLVKYGAWRLRLQPGSPCSDAGDDSVVAGGREDVDGQPRILGAHVDIGADEQDGTQWAEIPGIVRVRPGGNDAADGSSWELAKATLQGAIDSVWAAGGGEVWAAQGTYAEHPILSAWVGLYGGFAGNETERGQRDPQTHVAEIDGGGVPPVISCGLSGYRVGAIDGFRITGGGNYTGGTTLPPPSSPAGQGGGIRCAVSSPVIRGNEIAGNSLGDPNTAPFEGPGVGGGISLVGSHALIDGNIFADNEVLNRSSVGGAVYCEWSVVDLAHNTIGRNHAPEGAAVYCTAARPLLFNNLISQNENYYWPPLYFGSTTGAVSLHLCWDLDVVFNYFVGNIADAGGALYLDQPRRGTVANNLFVGNHAYLRQLSSGGEGRAIWLLVGSAPEEALSVSGNTFAGNTATSFYSGELGGAIAVLPLSAMATIANNVMAFNSSGIYQRPGFATNPVLSRNDLYNTGANYVGLPPGGTDLELDPLFADAANGDYRLQSVSPLVDEGDPGCVATAVDLDGAPRVQDGDADGSAMPDLGAYEYSPDFDADGSPDWIDADDDDDGAVDQDDCAPLDAGSSSTPGAVSDLVIGRPGELSWAAQPADVIYDVVSGRLSELFADGEPIRADCVGDDVSGPGWSDGEPDPPAGEARYYLVRAQNACGNGGWGASTAGPREVTACP